MADTLQLESVGGQSAGGVYVYPYNFSVDGSKTLTSLMCMDFNREVTIGEKWNVSIHGLSLASDSTSVEYRAEAWLYSQLGGGMDAADVQFAAWYIFDPAVVFNSGWKGYDMTLVTTALAKAQNTSLINSGFFSNYSLYIPLTDAASQGAWTKGLPQEFIGVAATPEPSAVVLFGTGLLCMAFLLRRRMMPATVSSFV